MGHVLYNTKKVPANNKSICCRCAAVHGCTFLQAHEDKIPAVPNHKGKKQRLHNSSDLNWDLDHSYLEIRGTPCDSTCESCKKHIDGQEISHPKTGWLWLCHVQHAHVVAAKCECAAEATVAGSESDCSNCPGLKLTDDKCDNDDNSMPQYTTKLSTRCEYMVAHLQDNLHRSFLCLKSYITQHNTFTVKDTAQLAHLANKDLNDLVESIAHIHCGDDPTSEKEALAGPDTKEWRKSMCTKLDVLVVLGCWTYKPKHLKLAGKKVF